MANRYELKMERLRQLSYGAKRRIDRTAVTDARLLSDSARYVDLFVSIYGETYTQAAKSLSNHPAGDYVLLSRGFAVHALVATLAQCGLALRVPLGDERLITKDLCWHPGLALPGVTLRSDTLCGLLAVAAELTDDARRRGVCAKAFVIVDASRLDSISFWDSLRLTAAQQPESLVLIVCRTQPSDGILVPSCSGSFDAFGWDVREVDGQSLSDLYAALHSEAARTPRVIVADTVHRADDSEVHSSTPQWLSSATGTDEGGWVVPAARLPSSAAGTG